MANSALTEWLSGLSFKPECREVQGSNVNKSFFSAFFLEKGEKIGENHDKGMLDQRVGIGEYHYNRTHDLKGKDHIV